MSNDDLNFWWSELNHGGMFLSPAILKEFLPEGPASIDPNGYSYRKLRDAYAAFDSWSQKENVENNEGLYRWIDFVFEEFLEYPSMLWQKGNDVSDRFKYQSSTDRLRPNRVLLDKGIEDNHRFLIKIDIRKGRLGMGKGRIEYSKFLTLLRGTKVQFGVFTNGYQFRLVYAGMDYDCWVEWDAARWFEEESGLSQLAGFKALCGRYATFKTDEDDFPLRSAVVNSRTRQGELSQVLGEQVRIAVEKVLSSFDKAARTHSDLLDPLRVDPVSKKEMSDAEWLNALYIAAIRVIMRMVVVLFAEARELLPRNMEKYHSSYGIEGLFASLEEAARHEGEENLKNRYSAWPRLLGLFWAAYDGCSNEDIPIPRYSGSLFKKGDPNSSDPVLRALSVLEDERWEVSDFIVLEILRLLKIGKVRARRGRSSTWVSGPVDFSDLRTEYIGMMYEGLLDYELKQVTKDQGAILFLNLGQQPALPLSLLESLSDDELKNLINKLSKEKATEISTEEEEDSEESEEIVEEMEQPEDIEEKTNKEYYEDDLTTRVMSWAERAVEVANLVKIPRGKESDKYAYELERSKTAKNLVLNIFGQDEMYLVRWSGTRKGTGTFYTRPQLAVPTVHRTLEPLVYDKNNEELTPKSPEKILNLKVVDPAMGSGSFLVAALRYLTDGLYESLLYHKKIHEKGNGDCVITLPFGEESSGNIKEELLPVRPEDERFEQTLKARLKRHVVERCIYGVDINNLAVELARLSLWIETMDRELPFEFLAHKLKVGNSLVGCWLDRFNDYPVLAWEREGGDGSQGEITKKIKSIYNTQVKLEMKRWILEKGPQKKLSNWTDEDVSTTEIQDENVDLYSKIHELKGSDREEFFRYNIQNNEHFKQLKFAMDKWCAVWFWPVYREDIGLLSPDNFYKSNEESKSIIEEIQRKIKFFHWELEFPDVFTKNKMGFDSVIGNPPWDLIQPESLEFFTKYDPIYRTYDITQAKKVQKTIFDQNDEIKKEWTDYSSQVKAILNWLKNINNPFDIKFGKTDKDEFLKKQWESILGKRSSFNYPKYFKYQGQGKANLYKAFLELSTALLQKNGRVGLIIPSGIYTDWGTTNLRKMLIENMKLEILYSFENVFKIFPIHSRFKFCVLIAENSGKTDDIYIVFLRKEINELEDPFRYLIKISIDDITEFSPDSLRFLEFTSDKDIIIARKINKIRTSNPPSYSREFNVTTKIKKIKEGNIPVFDGKDINQYSLWNNDPKYWTTKDKYISEFDVKNIIKARVVIREITGNYNTRTIISTVLPPASAHTYNLCSIIPSDFETALTLCAYYNSFIFDWYARKNTFLHTSVPFPEYPHPNDQLISIFKKYVLTRAKSIMCDPRCWPKKYYQSDSNFHFVSDTINRLKKICEIEAIIAKIFDLNEEEFKHVLDNFPLVDKGFPEEIRQTTLCLNAYKELNKIGFDTFINNGMSIPSDMLTDERSGISLIYPENIDQKLEKHIILQEEFIKNYDHLRLVKNNQKKVFEFEIDGDDQ
jgi:hypothetical protein